MKKIVIVFLMGLVFICCCSKKKTADTSIDNQKQIENMQITYKSIFKTFNSDFKERRYEVITNASDFKLFTKYLHLETELKVDFSKSNVAILNMSEKTTGGFDIQVVGLKEDSDKLILTVKEISPKPYENVTMAFTTPLEIIEINSKKDIQIVVE